MPNFDELMTHGGAQGLRIPSFELIKRPFRLAPIRISVLFLDCVIYDDLRHTVTNEDENNGKELCLHRDFCMHQAQTRSKLNKGSGNRCSCERVATTVPNTFESESKV